MLKTKVAIVKGVEGLSIYIGDIRICGNKPWGGGDIIKEWEIPVGDIFYALANLANPAFQPKNLKETCTKWCPWKATQQADTPDAYKKCPKCNSSWSKLEPTCHLCGYIEAQVS